MPLRATPPTKSTRHHGHNVEWYERAALISGMVRGVRVSIQKLHPSTYQPSRGGRLADPRRPRYRVLADGIFVQPEWGYRHTLKEAKDDGVAQAIKVADHRDAARAELAERRR